MLTILTRTSNRPNYFKNCRESIKNTKHIVICDTDEKYPKGDIILRVKKREGVYPYNSYFNDAKHLVDEYVMFLDDDDILTKEDSLDIIKRHLEEDTLVLWRVKFGNKTIPEKINVPIEFANISGIGFAYHVKHWIDWKDVRGGDYLVIDELSKKLKVVWIDDVLTGLQNENGLAGNGERKDI
jgi:hypothetical protein